MFIFDDNPLRHLGEYLTYLDKFTFDYTSTKFKEITILYEFEHPFSPFQYLTQDFLLLPKFQKLQKLYLDGDCNFVDTVNCCSKTLLQLSVYQSIQLNRFPNLTELEITGMNCLIGDEQVIGCDKIKKLFLSDNCHVTSVNHLHNTLQYLHINGRSAVTQKGFKQCLKITDLNL